jgi:hypothetical protein
VIGDTAWGMPMPDNDGHPVSLHDFRGKRVLLLFWNPACGFCARMLDDLRAWERSALRDAPQLIIVSTGSAAQNLEMDMRASVSRIPPTSWHPSLVSPEHQWLWPSMPEGTSHHISPPAPRPYSSSLATCSS